MNSLLPLQFERTILRLQEGKGDPEEDKKKQTSFWPTSETYTGQLSRLFPENKVPRN